MQTEHILLVVIMLVILFLGLTYYHQNEKFNDVYDTTLKGGYKPYSSQTSPDYFFNKKIKEIGYDGIYQGNIESVGVDEATRAEARLISSLIIKSINEKTKMLYVLGRIDQISVENAGGQRHYILDLFVHEVSYKITRRLLFDFLVKTDKSIVILALNVSNAYKYSDDAGHSQMNLDPMPELILKDFNLGSDYHIEGNELSSLPYSLFEGSVVKNDVDADKFKNWILPIGIQINDSPTFPCRRQGKWWDENGIQYTVKDTRNCHGINSSPMRQLKYPKFNPTINMSLTDGGNNSWLFEKSLGMLSDSFSK